MKRITRLIDNISGKDASASDGERFCAAVKKLFLFSLFALGAAALVYFVRLSAKGYVGENVRFFYPRLFGDFTQTAFYSVRKDAYLLEGGSSYSALSLLLILPFALIFKKDLATVENAVGTDLWGEQNMRLLASRRFWTAFLLYHALVSVALFFLIGGLLGGKKRERKDAFTLFLASAPVVYGFLRGNIVLIALIFTLIFLLLYRSESRLRRELALLSLAAAGVVKLYPLFFCAYLLHDKKWFATARAFAYFALLYCLPVLLYDGGFPAYFRNLLDFAGGESRLAYATNVSLASLAYKGFFYTAGLFHAALPSWTERACMLFGFSFLPFAAAAAVVSDSPLDRGVLSLCAVTLVAPVGYYYAAVFAVVPFAEYLKTYGERSAKENGRFFALCTALGFYPLYAANLYAAATLILTALGVLEIRNAFRGGAWKDYFRSRRGKPLKKGEGL